MPDTPDRPKPLTIIAFDYGLRRIGVAVGQGVTGSANPLGVVANRETGPDWTRMDSLLDEWRPARLVVGMPHHADGSRSDIANCIDAFILDLGRYSLPIETVDERYTSLEAREMLVVGRKLGVTRRIQKEMIDAAAAVLIAERWLATNP